MRKHILFCLFFATYVLCQAADYGIIVNGETYYAGTLNPNPQDNTFTEYIVLNVFLHKDETLHLYDNENKASWVVTLDSYSVDGVVKEEDTYRCTSSGCYDFYIKLKYESDQLYIGYGSDCTEEDTTTTEEDSWTTAVPANCEDVMMQCFYWDSYQEMSYGNTRWITLTHQMEDIASYFDMIWLPPSAQSAGGLGYHPEKLSNQNCALGSERELKDLIAICHANNTKVIADVVLNHRWNLSSWCDFYKEDFGRYGQFQLTKEHICSDDEVWTNATDAECRTGTRGSADTGEKYLAARDLDHTSSDVQQLSKAYLKFLQHSIGYDGFRWDVAKGFRSSIFGAYIADAKPYFSVGEYFDYSYDALKSWVDGTGKRSAVFDFAGKANGYHSAFIDGKTPNLLNLLYEGQPRGLIGAEYKRYAVTFIDNHDTFERSDAQDKEFLGYKKSMTAANKTNVLMANAWLLSMPGIPCVFYPHWAKYKDEIKAMIIARKTAGVHSMSAVTVNESASDKIIATIRGNKSKMILKLGSGAGCDVVPSGYKKMAFGTNYAIFVETTASEYEPHIALSLTITPKGGTFVSPQQVSITTNKPGASIYYTLDGSTPTSSSQVYRQAITVSSNTTLKTMAIYETDTTIFYTAVYTFVDGSDSLILSTNKPTEWETLYLYAWTEEGEEILGVWPGSPIVTLVNDTYIYVLAPEYRPINIIWTDGTNQTQDILDVTKSTHYHIENNIATWTGTPGDGETSIPSNCYTSKKTVYKILIDGRLFIKNRDNYINVLGRHLAPKKE